MPFVKLHSEKETGNIEYKIRLCNDTEHKINQLGTQMLSVVKRAESPNILVPTKSNAMNPY